MEEETELRASTVDAPWEQDVADEDAQTLSNEQLTMAQREARRLARKPDISHLDDAIVDDEDVGPLFLIDVGGRVIIERWTSLLPGRPWLDTRVFEVRAVDQLTGELRLWDNDLQRIDRTNFKLARAHGHVFKVPPPKGNPFAKPKPERAKVVVDGSPKKRGRPKGSKNRLKGISA